MMILGREYSIDDVRNHVADRGGVQRLLVWEMVEDRWAANSDSSGDLIDSSPGVAMLTENIDRAPQDLLAALSALSCGGQLGNHGFHTTYQSVSNQSKTAPSGSIQIHSYSLLVIIYLIGGTLIRISRDL